MYYFNQKNVLSEQECNKLINLALKLGFEPAKVQVYGEQKNLTNIRNNTRLEFEDAQLAENLTQVLKQSLSHNFPIELNSKKFVKLSNHFRMYCYKPGEYFKPHKDGHYKENNLESYVTALFYLNDTTGGETVLMPNGFKDKSAWMNIQPTQGSVLLFEHDIFHEGKQVSSGEKYVLRTDLFYK